MATDTRGRASRERLVHSVATPETIRKLDNVTIDRLYANGFLRGEHVDAWLEIHDAWKALSRGLGLRLMRFGERTDPTKGEVSNRDERLISRYAEWHHALGEDRKQEHEVVIASTEGYPLYDMGERVEDEKLRFRRAKRLLRNGLQLYCELHGMG